MQKKKDGKEGQQRHPEVGGEENQHGLQLVKKQHHPKGAASTLLWANVSFSLTSSSLWARGVGNNTLQGRWKKQHHTKKAASTLIWAGVAVLFFSVGWWCFPLLLLCVVMLSSLLLWVWCCFPLGWCCLLLPPFGWCWSETNKQTKKHHECDMMGCLGRVPAANPATP